MNPSQIGTSEFSIQKEVPSTHAKEPSAESNIEGQASGAGTSAELLQSSFNDERYRVMLAESVQSPMLNNILKESK